MIFRADRIWVNVDGGRFHVYMEPPAFESIEYMRVLSRAEVEKLACGDEGTDVQQVLNSMARTIEGQRRTINQLQGRV